MKLPQELHPWLMLVLLTVSGCGGSDDPDRPEVAPAGGVVNHQGEPVAEATVNFHPQQDGGHAAYGKTDAGGRFRLQTFAVDDGAVPGDYRVTVHKNEAPPPAPGEFDPDYDPEYVAPAPKSLLPDKYGNPATSGLTAKVVAGQDNEFPLELKD